MTAKAKTEGPKVGQTEKAENPEISDEEKARNYEANLIMHRNVLWAMGAGAIPFPIIDIAAVSAAQLKMLAELSKLYDVEFSKTAGVSFIAALVGGASTDLIAKSGFSFLKTFPGIGTIVGTASMSIVAGASTFAVWTVFDNHFKSGGDFRNFDPSRFKQFYSEKLEEGKKFVEGLKAKKDKKSAEEPA